MKYPKLTYLDERGWVSARDALLMCFYVQQSHQRIASDVVRALEMLRERIHPYRFTRYAGEEQTEPLTEAAWQHIRQELLGPEAGSILQLEDDSEAVGGLYVDYRGLPFPMPWPARKHDVSVLYVCLPTEYLEERGPEHVRALALDMARELPFNSGYVDLAVCETGWRCDALHLVHPRYPGIHLARSGAIMHMNTWVDGVHWMNFLGQPVLGQLGGVAGLRERLSLPGLSIEALSGDRGVLTLGAQPDPGDTQQGHTLPLHRALARILEPYLYHRQPLPGSTSPEQLQRWERRFLD